MRDTIVDTFEFLKSSKNDLPYELSPASLEIAEQSENNAEVEFLDQLIVIVKRLLLIKQTQTSSVAILADFFCPLSLELMTDPVIVSSGQTYENRSNDSREMKVDAAPGRSSVSSTTRGSVENGQTSENHHRRSPSATSTVSNEEFPRGDANDNSEESAHATPYSSDASGEIRQQPLRQQLRGAICPTSPQNLWIDVTVVSFGDVRQRGLVQELFRRLRMRRGVIFLRSKLKLRNWWRS